MDSKRLRVVVADDSTVVRDRLVSMISELPGVQVVGTAGTAPDAIRLTDELRPDVLTLDWRMPGGSGASVLAHLQSAPVRPQIFVLSNFALAEFRDRARHLGATAFFNKSGEFGGLMSRIRQLAGDPSDGRSADSVRRQAALARLSAKVVAFSDLQQFLDETVVEVSAALRMEFCRVQEVSPRRDSLVMRAGTGWKSGFTAEATTDAAPYSFSCYVLRNEGAVAVGDVSAESRFVQCPFLNTHGVVSSLGIRIGHNGSTYGVLGVHSADERVFDAEEVGFIEVVASLISSALLHHRQVASLRQSEERFRHIVESADEWIWEVDADGLYTYCSPAVERILGYTPAEVVGSRRYHDFFAPRVRDGLMEAARTAFARRSTLRNLVNVNLHKDGHEVILETTAVPIIDANGRFHGYCGADTDITARKKAEAGLDYHRGLLEETGRMAQVGGWEFDPATGRGTWTEETARIYDLEPWMEAEAVLGPGLFEGESRARMQSCLRAAVDEGKAYDLELELTTVRGNRKWIRTTGRPVREGDRVVRIRGSTQDITARRRTLESQARLTTAIEQAFDSVVVTDAAGTIQYVNPAFTRTTGYSADEAIGQNPRVLKSGRHDTGFYARLWQTIASGHAWQGRFVNRRKDGGIYEEEATISPVTDATGRIVNYVAVKRDITVEVQLEGQLRQSQKMESLGLLAGGVAHDFNNILQAILGFADLLLAEGALTERQRRDLGEIRSSGRRAADLTRQLLAFSNHQIVEPVALDLNAVVTGMEKMLHRIIGEDIRIGLDLAAGLPAVRADAGQLEQVIMNLAVNARDAMSGGGQLSIGTDVVQLDEAAAATTPDARPGRFVRLTVADTGVGMSPEIMARAFEPFFTTKGPGKGTGLGLSVIYGIARRHEGWVDLESAPGRGTTIRVCLPATEEAAVAASSKAAIPRKPPRGSGERVLLIEDEPQVRSLTGRVLREAGYEVVAAAGVVEGCSLFEGEGGRFDLLFSDIVLPDGSGIAAADSLLERQPALAVLLCSGYADERIKGPGPVQLRHRFIAKPYATADLLRNIRCVLDARRGTKMETAAPQADGTVPASVCA